MERHGKFSHAQAYITRFTLDLARITRVVAGRAGDYENWDVGIRYHVSGEGREWTSDWAIDITSPDVPAELWAEILRVLGRNVDGTVAVAAIANGIRVVFPYHLIV
jgi:hypothetical protein